MPNPPRITLKDAANSLNVSPTVLQRWLDEFNEFFFQEEQATSGEMTFSEADMAVLETIRDTLNEGHSFEHVHQLLHDKDENAGTIVTPDVIPVGNDEAAVTTIGYFSEIVEDLHKGQLSVLNSQAANRELMGVLIQDNFNLKEENQRLRERMLDVERRLGQLQRDEISRRENLRQEIEAKLSEIRMQIVRNPVTVLQERTGCLNGLLGGSRVKSVDLNTPQSTPPQQNRPPHPPGPPE